MRKLKVLIASLLLFMGSSLAFAYDGSVFGDTFGKYSRREFIDLASDMDYAKELVETATDDADILRFYNVNDDNLDEEDLDLIEGLEDYIFDNYSVKNKSCYFHVIVRGETDDGWDGWMVLSHYSDSADFYHYVYYFEVED